MKEIKVFISSLQSEFIQEEIFKTIIWRKVLSEEVTGQVIGEPTGEPTGQVTGQPTGEPTGEVSGELTGEPTGQATGQPTGQVTEYSRRVILVVSGELKRSEIQDALELKHRETFMENYLNPAITQGFVEMTYPDNPNHPYQKYRLTAKGLELKKKLKKSR
ncbi:PT domain-containing protein [Bacteroidota bacterium]